MSLILYLLFSVLLFVAVVVSFMSLQQRRFIKLRGPRGFTGKRGIRGHRGISIRGFQGYQGYQAVGKIGLQGFQGLQGACCPGQQGLQGLQGLQGMATIGLQGLQGIATIGLQGYQGYQGFQGYQGVQGLAGIATPGLQGYQGLQGRPGGALLPALIGRYYTDVPFDISTPGTILPLGNLDGGVSPLLLRYFDPSPGVAAADRWVQVLPGGAGTYLLNYSLLAVSIGASPVQALSVQLQVDSGAGYDTSMPEDLFDSNDNAGPFPFVFYSGSVPIILSVQDNDKIHIAVTGASVPTEVGGGAVPTRSVAFTMTRINM